MTLRLHKANSFSKTAGLWLRCFLERRLVSALAVLCCWTFVSIACSGQLVEVPCKGTVAECSAKFEEFCASSESTAANLTVPTKTKIWGVLIDPTGAVFANPEPGLAVELRDPKTARVLVSSHVSAMGTFDIGAVSPGSYRLIAILIIDGKATRYRGWDQPKGLACGVADNCTIAALLRPHGTDDRIDFCPPK